MRVLVRLDRFDRHRALLQLGGGHLAGHETRPDQVVELERGRIELTAQRIGCMFDVGWPNGLMRLLGA